MAVPVKILLAEDDADDRIFFLDFLRGRKDIEWMPPVENGSELLAALKQAKQLPGMIILDQNMPKLNGIQTLHFLKTDPRYAGIPVMIYSTYANDLLVEEGLNRGATMVASKPSDPAGYNRMMDDFFDASQKV